MTALATRLGGRPWGAGRPMRATARLCALGARRSLAVAAPVAAQIFGDRPPPVPPAAVPLPDGIGGGAVSLAPPSGPAVGAGPAAVDACTADDRTGCTRRCAAGCAAAPPSAPGQAVLAFSAKVRQGPSERDRWRHLAHLHRQARRKRRSSGCCARSVRRHPNIVLPPGSYVVHASLGLASAVRPVTLRQETTRELFEIPAGGLRIEGRVGTTRIPVRPGDVQHLQGQPVRRGRAGADRAERSFRRHRADSRKAPTTSSRTTATAIRSCARTSACRQAS